MSHTTYAFNGMVSAPHHAAAQAGADILRRGGNAVEAAVATAAALSVVYPHMTGLGGDCFFLISPQAGRERGEAPLFVDGSGPSGRNVTRGLYHAAGLDAVPKRGPLAAATVAGSVGAWEKALELAAGFPGTASLPLPALFEAAVAYAESGFAVSGSQSAMTEANFSELSGQPGFAGQFLKDGAAYRPGERCKLPALAETMRRLGHEGLSAFYRTERDKNSLIRPWESGSPLTAEDLAAYRAEVRPSVGKHLFGGRLYNSPPPTQGAASLMILALMERWAAQGGLTPKELIEPATLVHMAAEATKRVFAIRNERFADHVHMPHPVEHYLEDTFLDALAEGFDLRACLPAPATAAGGDTVWFGAADRHGTVVSAIQSIYHEFGSGVVLANSGVTWQNRSLGFSMEPGRPNSLAPGKKPFHTLNPALAVMDDGRCIAYGSMGGDGQPQTQAAIFLRAFVAGLPLQDAVNAPRWLLGRAWGDQSTSLKMEDSFGPEVLQTLRDLGHEVESVPAPSSLMGHAGAVVLHPDGLMEGAADARSDGCAAGW